MLKLFGMNGEREAVETSPRPADEIKYSTCYMCACRCGIKVHLQDGDIRYIQGNPNHPTNKGVLCAKGSAGIMTQQAPAKLTKPLLRVGERGEGKFKQIEWDEALSLAQSWLSEVRQKDPRKLAFFTGRDQSQSLTGWWASAFGTPNYAAHGGFCSVNMAAAGLYTVGGSFWEFGEPDWELTKYFLMFGVTEDHDSNPIKIGLGKLKGRRGTKFVSVNPVRTGYSAIADEWVGIRPGTDGLLVMALIHELLRADKIDFDYLARYTNAAWLVDRNDGLFIRDADGAPMLWDRNAQAPANAMDPSKAETQSPTMVGEVDLADGRRAVPVFQLIAERYTNPQYGPEAASEVCGVPAPTIRRLAAELAHVAFEEEITLDVAWTDWLGRRHEKMIGRPVSMHAMRGISAHSNGFHTCRAIHLLQVLLGSIEVPGGFRYKPPFPRPIAPPQKPAGKEGEVKPNSPLPGPPLGFPMAPEDLLVDSKGTPLRIDKAFSWENPLSIHGLMHMVITNAWKGDPYPVDVLFMYMANMAWNSTMNTSGVMDMLRDKDPETGDYKIPKFIYVDAYESETVAFADLVLPDTTYLERWDCISLLDRPICEADGPADAIRQPIIAVDRDVRPFQDVLLDLGARLGLPGMVDESGAALYPGGYADYMVNHERGPGIGPLAGWRGPDGSQHGRGGVNKNQLQRYIDNECFWTYHLDKELRYYKFANKAYLEWAAGFGMIGSANPIVMQLYSEPLQKFRLAAQGRGAVQPPEADRARIETYFDPLPIWYVPLEEAQLDGARYPLHALTQRPMQMYHSWGSQNAWLRQITTANRLHIHRATASKLGVADDDWVWVESPHGRIRAQVRLVDGVEPNTVWTWNAIGKRSGAWALDPEAAESKKGFLLNHLISELLPDKTRANVDPVTGQAAWFDLRVRIEKALGPDAEESFPQFSTQPRAPGGRAAPRHNRYGRWFKPRSWHRKEDDAS